MRLFHPSPHESNGVFTPMQSRQSRLLPLLTALLTALLWLPGNSMAQSPTEPEAAIELPFRDFFRLPLGPYGAQISERLALADGRRVRLVGYMVQRETATPGQFLLTPRPVQMSEHADGDANDLPPATVLVRLDPSQADWAVPHVRGLVGVTGVLEVGRREQADGQVFWVGLQLGAEATRSMSLPELAGFLHQQQHRH